MKLISEIKIPSYNTRIDHRGKILMMGSCFAGNMGRIFERYLFPVCVNPFGTVFNPQSVLTGLRALKDREYYTRENLHFHAGQWFSYDHYTGFSDPDPDRCLEKINGRMEEARPFLAEARFLLITWGTSWIYSLKDGGRVVSNCHKVPAREFERRRMDPEEIRDAYREFLPELWTLNPDVKVLLTVSPVRHLKDGAHGNQLSKASLLLAAEELRSDFPGQVEYFPSYEIVLDELRDYRFYDSDLVHPNELATRYIWEKVESSLVSEESREIIKDLEPYLKLMEHRPRENSATSLVKLEEKSLELRAKLEEKYPFIDF